MVNHALFECQKTKTVCLCSAILHPILNDMTVASIYIVQGSDTIAIKIELHESCTYVNLNQYLCGLVNLKREARRSKL